MKILYSPDAEPGLEAPPAAPAAAKPSATPPPASTPPPAAPAPAAAAPEPNDDPFAQPAKPAATSTPPAKPAATPAAAPDFDKLAPKELRERVKQLNAEKESSSKRITELEAAIKEGKRQGEDVSALTAQIQAERKEKESAQAELRAARQEASPDFKEKFDKPFNQAAERARKQITELTVVADAETGATRPATWEDFSALYSLPVGKAIEQANALFGTAANFVLQQREKLLDLDTARSTALQEEKAQFKERSAKEIAEQAVKREGVGKMWLETNKRLSETVEDYKNDSTDTESADARKHALAVFDSQINAADHDDFVKQKVLKDAHVRQRVGAYAVQKVQIARLKSEKEALQKQVDELKGTAPGGTQRPGGDAPPIDDKEDWGAAMIREVKSKAG